MYIHLRDAFHSLTPTYIKTHKLGMSLNQTDTHSHARSLACALTPSLSDFLLLRSPFHTPSFSLSIFPSLFLSLLCVRMRQRLYPHAPSINFILIFLHTHSQWTLQRCVPWARASKTDPRL